MKLAIASQDGKTISRHFGRSSCFIIYDIDRDQVKGHTVRQVPSPIDKADHHSHLIKALEGCQAVLCGGIGDHAAERLHAEQINALVTLDAELEPDEAVRRLLVGTLRAGWVHACCCQHNA